MKMNLFGKKRTSIYFVCEPEQREPKCELNVKYDVRVRMLVCEIMYEYVCVSIAGYKLLVIDLNP